MRLRLYENYRFVLYAPFYAAHAIGAYAAEGLEVEPSPSPGMGRAEQALLDGTVEQCLLRPPHSRRRRRLDFQSLGGVGSDRMRRIERRVQHEAIIFIKPQAHWPLSDCAGASPSRCAGLRSSPHKRGEDRGDGHSRRDVAQIMPSRRNPSTSPSPMPSQLCSTSALSPPSAGDGFSRTVLPSIRTGQVAIL